MYFLLFKYVYNFILLRYFYGVKSIFINVYVGVFTFYYFFFSFIVVIMPPSFFVPISFGPLISFFIFS